MLSVRKSPFSIAHVVLHVKQSINATIKGPSFTNLFVYACSAAMRRLLSAATRSLRVRRGLNITTTYTTNFLCVSHESSNVLSSLDISRGTAAVETLLPTAREGEAIDEPEDDVKKEIVTNAAFRNKAKTLLKNNNVVQS